MLASFKIPNQVGSLWIQGNRRIRKHFRGRSDWIRYSVKMEIKLQSKDEKAQSNLKWR
jgi:hypothetical protein